MAINHGGLTDLYLTPDSQDDIPVGNGIPPILNFSDVCEAYCADS